MNQKNNYLEAEMTPEELWDIVHPSFKNDDGSLPNIEIQNLIDVEIGRIYKKIRQNSQLVTEDPSYWSTELQCEKHIDDVSNAALLVAKRKAEPFHFSVDGVKYNDIEIPCLGFFIFQDLIAIDYRMGNQWQAKQVFAFFSWLKELIELTYEGSLTSLINDGPPNSKDFLFAWKKFLEAI